MTGPPDLEQILERAKAAEELNVDLLAQFISPNTRSIGAWIAASALDVPRLLAAIDAVLALHSRWEIRGGEDGGGDLESVVCRHCCAADGGGHTEECAGAHLPGDCWPCPTVRAVDAALGDPPRPVADVSLPGDPSPACQRPAPVSERNRPLCAPAP